MHMTVGGEGHNEVLVPPNTEPTLRDSAQLVPARASVNWLL